MGTSQTPRGARPAGTCLIESVERRVLMSGTPVPVNGAAEFQVNVQTAGDQGLFGGRSVAADAQGNFVVTWANSPIGTARKTIYARRFDAGGAPLGPEIQVSAPDSALSYPAVAENAGGQFIITWDHSHTSGRTTVYELHARRYAADGTPQGQEFLAGATTASTSYPEAAIADDGSSAVAWQRTDTKAKTSDNVYLQRFDAAGGMRGTEVRVNDYVADEQRVPSLVMDGAGNCLVAWQSYGQDGNDWGVYARRYDAAGVATGGEVRVSEQAAGRQNTPSAALLPGGGFAVAYNQAPTADLSATDVFLRRFDGAAWSPEVRVNTFTAGGQANPCLAVDASGTATVIWQSAGQDGSKLGMYGQQYDATGQPLGGEVQLNTYTAEDQSWSGVAAQPGGRFVAAWTSTGQDGSGQGVYARLFQQPPAATVFGTTAISTPFDAGADVEPITGLVLA